MCSNSGSVLERRLRRCLGVAVGRPPVGVVVDLSAEFVAEPAAGLVWRADVPVPAAGTVPTAVLAGLRPGVTLARVLLALGDPSVFEGWVRAAGEGGDSRAAEWRRADLAVSVAQAWESQLAWSASRRELAVAGAAELLEALRPADPVSRWSTSEVASAELAAALRVSPRSMGGVLDRAQRLTGGHAGTLWLLEQGFITAAHARVMLDECQVVADRADVVARLDPEGDAERHERAAALRELRSVPLPDGMAMLTASLTAPEAQTVMAALDAVAAELPGDSNRSRASGRVDALVLLCSAVLGDPTAVASVVRSTPAEPAVG